MAKNETGWDWGSRPAVPHTYEPEKIKRALIGFDRDMEGRVKIEIVKPLGWKKEED